MDESQGAGAVPLDIGIMMRPDILRRKQSGEIAYWHFYEDLPRILPGRRVWVSVVKGKWAGFFIVKEILRDTREISWDPASWTAMEFQWIDHSTYPIDIRESRWEEREHPYEPFDRIYSQSRRRVPYTYHVPSNRLGYQRGAGRVHKDHTLHVDIQNPSRVRCFTCGNLTREVAVKPAEIDEAWPYDVAQWGRNVEPYTP